MTLRQASRAPRPPIDAKNDISRVSDLASEGEPAKNGAYYGESTSPPPPAPAPRAALLPRPTTPNEYDREFEEASSKMLANLRKAKRHKRSRDAA